MSFKIGQFRSDGNSPERCLRELDFDPVTITNKSEFASKTDFIDKGLKLARNDVNSFQADKYYYIQLAIMRFGFSDQDLTFKLVSVPGDDGEIIGEQFLDNMTNYATNVGYPSEKDPQQEWKKRYYTIVELVVSPDAEYNRLDIVLTRNIYDYVEVQNDVAANEYDSDSVGESQQNVPIQDKVYKGRIISIDKQKCKIYEIVNKMPGTIKTLNKLGVQGPPGMLMCINGQGIRIGPSGIYEIKNGYKITFLGFVPKISQNESGEITYDQYIVDYQYDEKNIQQQLDEQEG